MGSINWTPTELHVPMAITIFINYLAYGMVYSSNCRSYQLGKWGNTEETTVTIQNYLVRLESNRKMSSCVRFHIWVREIKCIAIG